MISSSLETVGGNCPPFYSPVATPMLRSLVQHHTATAQQCEMDTKYDFVSRCSSLHDFIIVVGVVLILRKTVTERLEVEPVTLNQSHLLFDIQ